MYFHPTADQIAINRLTNIVRAHDPDLARGRDRSGAVAAGMTRAIARLLDTMTADEIAAASEDRAAWHRLFAADYYGDEPASHYTGLTAVLLPSAMTAAMLYRERIAEEKARAEPVSSAPGTAPRGRHFKDILAARMAQTAA